MGKQKKNKADRSTGGKRPTPRPAQHRPRINTRSPVFRFVVVLVVLMCVFNALFYGWISNTSLFGSYLSLNAEAAGSIINFFGEEVTIDGDTITTNRFSLGIRRGCDALQASAFFVFLVLASPTGIPIRRRLPFLIAGTAGLLTLNLLRIITLYYSGIYAPKRFFDFMHVEFWQAIFIFLPLFLWVMWALKKMRAPAKPTDAKP